MKYLLKLYGLIMILFVFFVAVLVKLRISDIIPPEIFIGVLLTLATISISIINFYRENDQFFKALFTEFNERYDKLNGPLGKILHKSKLDADDEIILIDYFNLCAEEYMWLSKGRIPTNVWSSWLNGIKIYLESPIIFEFYKQERSKWKSSYYGFFEEEIKSAR